MLQNSTTGKLLHTGFAWSQIKSMNMKTKDMISREIDQLCNFKQIQPLQRQNQKHFSPKIVVFIDKRNQFAWYYSVRAELCLPEPPAQGRAQRAARHLQPSHGSRPSSPRHFRVCRVNVLPPSGATSQPWLSDRPSAKPNSFLTNSNKLSSITKLMLSASFISKTNVIIQQIN